MEVSSAFWVVILARPGKGKRLLNCYRSVLGPCEEGKKAYKIDAK
jgi:hypothetical protein